MKKLGMILLTFCIATPMWGMPNYTGTRGLMRVISAKTEPVGRFNYTFGLRAHWMRSTDTLLLAKDKEPVWDVNGKPVTYAEKGQCVIGDLPLGMGFSFTDYLSLNLNATFFGDIMQTQNEIATNGKGLQAVSYGWGDVWIGVKFLPSKLVFSPELRKMVDFGIYPVVSFYTGMNRGEVESNCAADTVLGTECRFAEGGIHRFYTAGGLTAGGKALLTFNLGDVPQLPVHLNFGYQTYPYMSHCSKYSYGVGVEVIYPKFAPFIEIYGEHRIDKDYDDGGIYVSPALRFETAANIWMTLSADLRIAGTDDPFFEEANPPQPYKDYHIQGGFGTTPQWAINFTVSQSFDFMPPPPAEKAIVTGKVIDKIDGKPVLAKISLADTTVTTDESGKYEITVPAGKIVIYASPLQKGKYKQSPEVTRYVTSGAKEIINFRLERKEVKKIAILTGKVIDKISRKSCMATISFPESEFPEVKSDVSGVYRTEVPTGTYVVKVEKAGYISQTHPAVLKEGETTVLNFELTPSTRVSTLAGKTIDYSSRKGIGATISFPNTEIPDIHTDPETGTYKAEIPAGTHQVKVKSEGYIPEGVVVVCKPEATNVKNFELFKKEERIVLHGITFEYNRADIRPSSYSVLDEAVELLKKHPEVKIEVGGHTDSDGSNSYNLDLSHLRAESVKRYLVNHGISASMLRTRGYGESQPVASNRTAAGKSQNRRIEFRVLSQ